MIKSLDELNKEFQQDFSTGDTAFSAAPEFPFSLPQPPQPAEPFIPSSPVIPDFLKDMTFDQSPSSTGFDPGSFEPPPVAPTQKHNEGFAPLDTNQIFAGLDILNDISDAPSYHGEKENGKKTHKSAKNSRFLSRKLVIILSSFLLVLILFTVLPGMLGYSWHAVVSDSMAREIPKGSLVINKRTSPESIKIGDNVTYRRKDGTTVTHKVIGIIENCGGSSSRGFVTRGTENVASDTYTVLEEHVVGVVQTHFAGVGDFLLLMKTVFIILLILLPVSGIAILIIRKIRKKGSKNIKSKDDRFSDSTDDILDFADDDPMAMFSEPKYRRWVKA